MTSADTDPVPAPDARAEPDGEALRAAFGRLTAVLQDVAATADRSVRRRCPHRGVKSRCHYRAVCRNQATAGGVTVCGGDALVRDRAV